MRAQASDAQDGRIDDLIQWEITAQGQVAWQGTGGEQVVGLPFGTYELHASVTDSDGNIVTQVRNITVIRIPDSNLPPTVTIVFPTEGMELLAGIPTPLQATASDPEEGTA